MPPKQNNNNQQQKQQQNKPQNNNNNQTKQQQPQNKPQTNDSTSPSSESSSKPNNKSNNKKEKQPQQSQSKEQEQKEVPSVVTAIRTKQDITFISLPVETSKWPEGPPQRLKSVINNPTSDIIWAQTGDRCAVCTSDGILVYNTPLEPGSEFTLNLHAILPYTTARYLQFSPLGNYLLSFETLTQQCPVNLIIWDLSMWSNNVFSLPKETTTATTPEDSTDGANETPSKVGPKVKHGSIIYSMTQTLDLPTSPHSSVQWTDDEEFAFVLRNAGELLCFKSGDMTKPLTATRQKRLSLFQLSKIPKTGEKTLQHIALFSPCLNDEPAKCNIFKTLDIVRGKSIQSGGSPPPNAPNMPPRPIVWGPVKPCQQVAIFRTNSVVIQWHSASQALLLKTMYDDGSGQSYYGETRLYVVYVDKEAVAVSFGADAKGDIHDAAWCPTGFEFTTLHGPAKDATCTIWHARDCSAVRSIGSGPFNTIRYNPSGRLLLLAGIGSLSGKMEIWDKKTLVRLYKGQDTDSPRTINWSPCGRYLISATLFPFLRVGNQFKIHRFDGKELYQEKAKMSATTLSIAPEATVITLLQQGPENGHFLQVAPNFYPRTNIFMDVKIPQDLLNSAQVTMKTEPVAAPSAGKYVPPHLREQQQQAAPAGLTPVTSPLQQQSANNGPRDFLKEKKMGQSTGDIGFGARPATQASQQHHTEQQQQRQQQQSSNVDSGYSAWRR